MAPCGLRGCKNWPAPFPGRMSYKATTPGLVSVLYLSMRYTVLLFIRAPFYVSLFFIAMYFCLLVVLVKLSVYLPSDWLERLLWGSLIVVRGSSPESPGRRVRIIFYFSWFIVLLHCFIMYLCCLPLYVTYFLTVMARYSLFMLKVPLNPKQTNKQKIYDDDNGDDICFDTANWHCSEYR